MNTKTAEEITEALGFLQEYAKCGIWHNYMVNDEGREIKLKTMYDSIDLVKKRIEELEAEKKELIKIAKFYQENFNPSTNGKQD